MGMVQTIEKAVMVMAGNRITLPKDFIEKLGIKTGDYVIIRLQEDRKVMEVIPATIKPKYESVH
jgi:AbrB family looped-hinge helix DNA binding protein